MKSASVGTACKQPIMADDTRPLPLEPLPDLSSWWRQSKVQGAIIGGLAVAVRGRPRPTLDVDAVVVLGETSLAEFFRCGQSCGFMPRLPDALQFAEESHVLLLRHASTGVDADVSWTVLPFEAELVERATPVDFRGIVLPVATAEDLIIMKAVAHRDRDLIDIAGLVATNPQLDLARIRRWVSDFAATLEMPELLDDVERLLPSAKAPKQRRRKQ